MHRLLSQLKPRGNHLRIRHFADGARCRSSILFALAATLFGLLPVRSLAQEEAPWISHVAGPGLFPVVDGRQAAVLWTDTNDYPGVLRAVQSLQGDILRVTGFTPALTHQEPPPGSSTILIGTLGRSRLVDQLAREGKIDVSPIAGQWESTLIQVVTNPAPGIPSGLVIVGSDKRGTIYGVYELSAQIGVSPWYWWADVPVRHQAALFASPGRRILGPPAVKYRGIFLNDEAPSLTGWVHEKFGDYNHSFYTNVFELLLRLKANYLWPAMWNNCFNTDDPLNPQLADEYGIVMGTSHVEPMMRADKEWNRLGYSAAEWNYATHPEQLRAFWKDGIERNRPYENLTTIAMRGKIDTPMSESANIALLEQIVAAQRQLIEQVYHTNAAAIPQVWALYKEVQEYYEKGMRVPDDVTLLWSDDNWGNLRRLPTPAESGRSGGAGVYYHFDYVGGPRNYKWLNTVPITKIWEQMNLAYQHNANRIWIANVGDLKPMEFPLEFFLTLAWDPTRWPKEKLPEYSRRWAERNFSPEFADEIAELIAGYTKFNARRKPELLDPSTYSLTHYQEADRVLAEWQALAARAESLYSRLPQAERDAFYQLVLYPVKASAVVNELYITVGRNRLYAAQGRAGANALAARARALFDEDRKLSDYFNHTLAHGKWSHMMDQTHIGYTGWQQPASNTLPQVVELDLPSAAGMGVAVEGSASAWPGGTNQPALPPFDVFNRQQRYLDVFNRGRTPFSFSAASGAPWIVLSTNHATVQDEQRLWVSVDWQKVPKGRVFGDVTVASHGQQPITVGVEAFNPKSPTPESLRGFVETDGHVAIEAAHFTRNLPAPTARWEEIRDFGRSLSGMTPMPVTALSVSPPKGSPCLEYRMFLFTPGRVDVEAILAPTLNFVPGRGLRYAVSFDDQEPKVVTAVPEGFFVDNGNRPWEVSVEDSVRKVTTTLSLEKAGYHTFKFWMVDTGVVLEKLVFNLGGVRPSYLGPPESFRGAHPSSQRHPGP
jgi:hypothetical protein